MNNTWAVPGWIFWIILWVFIWPVFLIFLRRMRWHGNRSMSKTALDILNERYAKGEITKQEFEEKKRDIA